jgi:predicted transcriptional regulator
MPTALISLHPTWAHAILSGEKKWEFRRRPPLLKRELLLVIYATRPEQSLLGEFTLGSFLRGPIDELLDSTLQSPEVREKVTAYFLGTSIASAMEIIRPMRYRFPIKLSRVREIIPKFRVPQNFRYINKQELEIVRRLAETNPCTIHRFRWPSAKAAYSPTNAQ